MVFRRWVFQAYCREYPTRSLEMGIPAVGYSRLWVFGTRTYKCCNILISNSGADCPNCVLFDKSTKIGTKVV